MPGISATAWNVWTFGDDGDQGRHICEAAHENAQHDNFRHGRNG
jgi:hypothetical protein